MPQLPSPPAASCRLRIVNDAMGQDETVEMPRDAAALFVDLARFIRPMNRLERAWLQVAVRLSADGVKLHMHCPCLSRADLARATCQAGEPKKTLRRIDRIKTWLQSAAMASALPATRCRVKVVNDISGRVAIVETARTRESVFCDLSRLVERVNRRMYGTWLNGSVCLTAEMIVLHWHCPYHAADAVEFVAEDLLAWEPLRDAERIIWQAPPAAAAVRPSPQRQEGQP